MTDRRYTVEEIDTLRSLVKALVTLDMTVYSPVEVERTTELQLRTYIQNGTTVEELTAYLRKRSPHFDRLCREKEANEARR